MLAEAISGDYKNRYEVRQQKLKFPKRGGKPPITKEDFRILVDPDQQNWFATTEVAESLVNVDLSKLNTWWQKDASTDKIAWLNKKTKQSNVPKYIKDFYKDWISEVKKTDTTATWSVNKQPLYTFLNEKKKRMSLDVEELRAPQSTPVEAKEAPTIPTTEVIGDGTGGHTSAQTTYTEKSEADPTRPVINTSTQTGTPPPKSSIPIVEEAKNRDEKSLPQRDFLGIPTQAPNAIQQAMRQDVAGQLAEEQTMDRLLVMNPTMRRPLSVAPEKTMNNPTAASNQGRGPEKRKFVQDKLQFPEDLENNIWKYVYGYGDLGDDYYSTTTKEAARLVRDKYAEMSLSERFSERASGKLYQEVLVKAKEDYKPFLYENIDSDIDDYLHGRVDIDKLLVKYKRKLSNSEVQSFRTRLNQHLEEYQKTALGKPNEKEAILKLNDWIKTNVYEMIGDRFMEKNILPKTYKEYLDVSSKLTPPPDEIMVEVPLYPKDAKQYQPYKTTESDMKSDQGSKVAASGAGDDDKKDDKKERKGDLGRQQRAEVFKNLSEVTMVNVLLRMMYENAAKEAVIGASFALAGAAGVVAVPLALIMKLVSLYNAFAIGSAAMAAIQELLADKISTDPEEIERERQIIREAEETFKGQEEELSKAIPKPDATDEPTLLNEFTDYITKWFNPGPDQPDPKKPDPTQPNPIQAPIATKPPKTVTKSTRPPQPPATKPPTPAPKGVKRKYAEDEEKESWEPYERKPWEVKKIEVTDGDEPLLRPEFYEGGSSFVGEINKDVRVQTIDELMWQSFKNYEWESNQTKDNPLWGQQIAEEAARFSSPLINEELLPEQNMQAINEIHSSNVSMLPFEMSVPEANDALMDAVPLDGEVNVDDSYEQRVSQAEKEFRDVDLPDWFTIPESNPLNKFTPADGTQYPDSERLQPGKISSYWWEPKEKENQFIFVTRS